jgi:hypothetical protein
MPLHAMNRSYRKVSVIIFALAVFITGAGVAEKPTSAKPARGSQTLHRWRNLDWAHWDIPLFSLFGPFDHRPDISTVLKEIRDKKSSLDVYGFHEVILADDDKGITIVLGEQDSRLLKALAQKYDGRWFVAVAPPKDFFIGASAVAVVYMTPSMMDGHITFKHPECASIAQSLRRRFHIAEFRFER